MKILLKLTIIIYCCFLSSCFGKIPVLLGAGAKSIDEKTRVSLELETFDYGVKCVTEYNYPILQNYMSKLILIQSDEDLINIQILLGIKETQKINFKKEILILEANCDREKVRLYKFTDFFYDSKHIDYRMKQATNEVYHGEKNRPILAYYFVKADKDSFPFSLMNNYGGVYKRFDEAMEEKKVIIKYNEIYKPKL